MTIEPNVTYPLTITNSNPNGVAVIGGFQMTILDESDNKAGDFVAGTNDPNSAITSFLGRQYWEHDPAQLYPGSNSVSWTVSWKAPAMPPNETITWYAAINVANNNGNNGGDLIVTGMGSGMLNGGSLPLVVVIEETTNVLCNGGNTGSATALASEGSPPYTYTWSNGGAGQTISNLLAGTYTVTVTDNVGSTATASAVITQPTALVFQSPAISNVSCFGGNDGAITAAATGGVPPYFYDWSNGDTGASNTGLTAGSYTVTVTDANDCTKTATYQVNQPAVLEINLVSLNHETCNGENDGSITISVSGGTSPYFAEWSNGSIGNTVTGLAPDTYSVTVTDDNECTETATYTINPGGIVEVDLQQIQHVTCNGGNNGAISVIASGGVAPYTYAWSNGGTGPSINNLTAGNYLVTATDANGCDVVELYTVTQPGPINITISQTGQNLCAGDSLADLTAMVSGGIPPFAGLWSNGVVGLTNPDLPAGNYIISVTDGMNCSNTDSFTVTEPSPLIVTVSTTDETAEGANDGTASAFASGGTATYTYLWSNGQTTADITGLAPGTYTVTATDMNGCTSTGSGQVNAFGCTLDVFIQAVSLVVCDEEDVTSLEAVVSGATGNVTYLWSNGSTASSIIAGSGEHCVTVSDDSACQDIECISIEIQPAPVLVCPVVNESAPGANDGSIQCDSLEGFTYLWGNGATTSGITGLAPGEYCLTFTYVLLGCEYVQCFIVQPGNCNLSITSIVTDAQCAGDTNGSIFVNVENATLPITYAWSNGGSSPVANNLAAGDYMLTITDAAGCGEIVSFTINEPSPIVATVDSIIHITAVPGAVLITPSGGTPPYSFEWTYPDGGSSTDEDISGLTAAGFYTLVIRDSKSCTDSSQVLVELDLATGPNPVFKPLKVYPVPTEDVLHVEMEKQIVEALISGVDGRLYKRIMNPLSNLLPVGDLESGWYIIRITDGQSWYIARMVK
jgi:hypothetical protein